MAVAAEATPPWSSSPRDDAVNAHDADPLEAVRLGEGKWSKVDRSASLESATETEASCPDSSSLPPPPEFCTYLTRFLVAYDDGMADWWKQLQRQYQRLGASERNDILRSKFAAMAKTVELAVARFLLVGNDNTCRTADRRDYEQLWDALATRYAPEIASEVPQHMAILFALLPAALQPVHRIEQVVRTASHPLENAAMDVQAPLQHSDAKDATKSDSIVSLLPLQQYRCVPVAGGTFYAIHPSVSQLPDAFSTVGLVDVPMTGATRTPFGPLSSSPLEREVNRYSWETYAKFGVAGATGCALTHAIVIPLDVVKTKKQVDPVKVPIVQTTGTSIPPAPPQMEITSSGSGATSTIGSLIEREGLSGLFLGAEATLIGYFWYGLSVYPSYTLFKRVLAHGPILPPDVAIVHGNDIALLAGAMAAVIASLGLTPMEAARIRVVADPTTYRPLGVWGTLSKIAKEGVQQGIPGWTALYAGLPSLLARQVIFGSVKFLAFERSCEWIYATWPVLRDATWTCLSVSLVAGAASGTLSSIVSQPADSVLTYVAQNRDGSAAKLGLIEGCIDMVQKHGIGSMFRGVTSRCVWAGSIIAGQFLLYDVFRTYFGVSTDDLSQVYSIVIPTN